MFRLAYRNRRADLWELSSLGGVGWTRSMATTLQEGQMGFGKGALLWLIGVPLPIIILLALFWHH